MHRLNALTPVADILSSVCCRMSGMQHAGANIARGTHGPVKLSGSREAD